MSRFLLLAVILLNLVGCASVPMGDAAQDTDLKNFKVTQNKSGVYIYRNETLGAAIKMNVLLDNVLIGQTAAKTYIYQEVAPGKHLLSSLAENTDTLQFEALPGQILFIWQEVKMGLFAARVKLQIVEPAVGKKGVRESKLVASTAPTNNVSRLASASTTIPAEDVNAVPYIGDRGREIYRAYLTKATPKAFAIAESGRLYSAWGNKPANPADPMDVSERALSLCAKANNAPCKLYAVDNTVVWQTANSLTAPQAIQSQPQASSSTVGMQNKPSQPVRITPDMLQNKTWIFQHFSNPGRFGNVELSFLDGSVNAKNNVSATQGTYQTKEDMLCLSLKLWGESCMLVLKDVDGIILVSTNNSTRSRVTVK